MPDDPVLVPMTEWVEAQVLKLEAGDMLLLRTTQILSREQLEHLQATVRRALEETGHKDVRVLVLDGTMRVQVARPSGEDPYIAFVVGKLADVYGSAEEARRFIFRQWIAEHTDMLMDAGASIAIWNGEVHGAVAP